MNEALPRLPLTDQCCELGQRIAGIFDDENFSQADAVRVLFDVAVVACKFFEKEVAKGNIEWRKPQ